MTTHRAIATRVEPRWDNSSCRAYVNISLPALGLEIRCVRVIERADGSFYAAMPHQRNHVGGWVTVIQLTDPGLEAEVRRVALQAAGFD